MQLSDAIYKAECCNLRYLCEFLRTIFVSKLLCVICAYHLSTCLLGMSGLGTSTAKEAKEYFSDMARHRIPFRYSNTEDDTAIELVSSVALWFSFLPTFFYRLAR